MGLAMAQSGRLVDARAMWADLLPALRPMRPIAGSGDAPERLDQMMAASGKRAGAGGTRESPVRRHRLPARLLQVKNREPLATDGGLVTIASGWAPVLSAGPIRFYCGPDGTIWPVVAGGSLP
jgi:hypothetical protein